MFNGKYLVVLLVKYLVVSLCTNNETCCKYICYSVSVLTQ